MTPHGRGLAEPFGTLSELVAMHAQRAPARRAVVEGERHIDWSDLDASASRLAARLQQDGFQPGEVIAICAPTSIEYVVVFVGALRAGLTVAPISPTLTPESMAAMIADCGARRVFRGEALDAWLAPPGVAPRPVDVAPGDAFNIIYSSGTTGTPKGIVQPNAMRWAHMQRGPAYGYSPDSVTLISTPLYSNTTLVAVFPTLATGGTLVLMPKFDATGYLALAERHRATHTMLVPVQYARLMALEGFGRFDLSSFHMKFSTSAPFTAGLKADVLARWPGGLIEYYGMTEGGGTAVLVAHEHPDKLHTVGRPAPGHDIRVIDEGGRELAPGATGELVGRSGAMMTGYHRQREATAGAEWRDAEGRRFIRTGDVGRFDDDGFIVLLDRRKDVIISGGFNVYPSDLEAVLASHADVVEAAVVAKPSAEWGETPAAFVVARRGISLDPGELKQWANARLGRTQRIAEVRVVEALPRSSAGKVLKRALREAL